MRAPYSCESSLLVVANKLQKNVTRSAISISTLFPLCEIDHSSLVCFSLLIAFGGGWGVGGRSRPCVAGEAYSE